MNTATAMHHNTSHAINTDPLFVRHDLMVEMGRLELQLEHAEDADRSSLERRLQKIHRMLGRLTV